MKYADLSFRGEGMTILIRIPGGVNSYLQICSKYRRAGTGTVRYGVVSMISRRFIPDGDERVDRQARDFAVGIACTVSSYSELTSQEDNFYGNCVRKHVTDEPSDALKIINTGVRLFRPNTTDVLQAAN